MTKSAVWALPTFTGKPGTSSGVPKAFRSLGYRLDLHGLNKKVYGLPILNSVGVDFELVNGTELIDAICNLNSFARKHEGEVYLYPFTAKDAASNPIYQDMISGLQDNIKIPATCSISPTVIAISGGRTLNDKEGASLEVFVRKVTSNLSGTLTFALTDTYGGATDAVTSYCKQLMYKIKSYTPFYNKYGWDSFKIRNYETAFISTHAVIIEDDSADAEHFKYLAKRFNIPTRYFKP